MRRWLLPLVLLVPFIGGDAVAAPDDEEAAYRKRRREALIRRAQERVRPEDPGYGDVDELARTLGESRDAWRKIDDRRVTRAEALVGTGEDDGLIREASRYYRWLVDPKVASKPDIRALRQSENVDVAAPQEDEVAVRDLRRPLVLGNELSSTLSARWVASHDAAMRERLAALQSEEASTFGSDDRIRSKEQWIARVRGQMDQWQKRRGEIVQALDQMARMELALTREAGRRAVRIEALDEKPDDPKAQRARLAQWVEQQELRLLYLTVRRAVERTKLLDRAVAIAQTEEEAVGKALAAYLGERLRIRHEAQLARIESDGYEMRSDLRVAKTAAEKVAEAARPVWEARIRALEGCLALNDVVRSALALRRAVETRMVPTVPTVALPPDADVLDRLRGATPFTVSSFIDAARANMARLPGSLVAHLHAVSDERVAILDGLQALVTEARPGFAAYEDTLRKADEGLETYRALVATGSDAERDRHLAAANRWQGTKEADDSVYRPTWAAVERTATTATKARRRLASFRRDLTRLGPRSFGCRVDRKLQLDELGSAWDDVTGVAVRAERWITLRDEDNVWTFLRAHWWRVLAVLAILGAGLWGGRAVRGVLGRWLDAKAEHVASLTKGLSLDVEAQAERDHEERAAAEAKAIEETALQEAAGQDADADKKKGTGELEDDDAAEPEAQT